MCRRRHDNSRGWFAAASALEHTEPHVSHRVMKLYTPQFCVRAAETSSSSTYRTVLIVVGTVIGVLVLILAVLVCSYVCTGRCDAAPVECGWTPCFAHARQ